MFLSLFICFYHKPLTSDPDLTKKGFDKKSQTAGFNIRSRLDKKKPDGWCNNNITRQFHLFMDYDREYIMNNIS